MYAAARVVLAKGSKLRRRMKRGVAKRIFAIVLVVLAVVIGAGAWYVSDYYHADSAATLAAEGQHGDAAKAVAETDASISVGDPQSETGIILYPGAKVETSAYVPLAQCLADEGYYCVIVKMPFHLAFFGIDAADRVMGDNPSVKDWWIAGHSLGGAMASEYAHGASDKLRGIVFFAAYPAADLSDTQLQALTVYGSEDGVLNRKKLEESAPNLPRLSKTVVIEGGNHAGFGAYGPQKGDGEATIPADEQQREAARAVAEFVSAASAPAVEDPA